MTIQPFFDATLAIQVHALAALEALVLGIFLLTGRKGGRLHKALGYVWVTNMAIAIATSFFIHQTRMFGPFSFIHLLSIWGTWSLFSAVRHARAGNIRAHKGTMRGLYFGGVIVAGVLAFMPGRVLNRMLFDAIGEETGFALVLGLALTGLLVWKLRGRRYA